MKLSTFAHLPLSQVSAGVPVLFQMPASEPSWGISLVSPQSWDTASILALPNVASTWGQPEVLRVPRRIKVLCVNKPVTIHLGMPAKLKDCSRNLGSIIIDGYDAFIIAAIRDGGFSNDVAVTVATWSVSEGFPDPNAAECLSWSAWIEGDNPSDPGTEIGRHS